MTDVELGIVLNQQYQSLIQTQVNIQALTAELNKRNVPKE